MMRQMMQQFSSFGGGFLDKIPGFSQLNSLRQMKDMDLGSMLGDLMGGGGGGGAPGGGLPGVRQHQSPTWLHASWRPDVGHAVEVDEPQQAQA